ncbi:MAG TPA: hypothetical protein VK152_00395 [Paludibacter sp.]|nr:hypothetical protein [Paludibacter sp.]
MKKQTNLTLPEWAFLDGTSQLGNTLEGRDVLLHVRTNTVIEIFATNEMQVKLRPGTTQKQYEYKDVFGINEHFTLAVHFSAVEFGALDEVLDKAWEFFTGYMDWEDKNIMDEENSKHN